MDLITLMVTVLAPRDCMPTRELGLAGEAVAVGDAVFEAGVTPKYRSLCKSIRSDVGS